MVDFNMSCNEVGPPITIELNFVRIFQYFFVDWPIDFEAKTNNSVEQESVYDWICKTILDVFSVFVSVFVIL